MSFFSDSWSVISNINLKSKLLYPGESSLPIFLTWNVTSFVIESKLFETTSKSTVGSGSGSGSASGSGSGSGSASGSGSGSGSDSGSGSVSGSGGFGGFEYGSCLLIQFNKEFQSVFCGVE